jgi:hypothetical protein
VSQKPPSQEPDVAVPDPAVVPDPDIAPVGQGGEPEDAGDHEGGDA